MKETFIRNIPSNIKHVVAVLILSVSLLLPAVCLMPNAYAASSFPAPELTKLQYYQTAKGSYSAKLSWKSKKGQSYQVLRKSGSGSWKVIARVKATASTTSYVNNNINGKGSYHYSVRRVSLTKKGKVKLRGKYDKTGLKTLSMPAMSVDFTNVHAKISWKKVSGASKYLIYRKIGANGISRHIASVPSTKLSYTDVYADSAKDSDMMALLKTNYFVDPSDNSISYYVRAYKDAKVGKTKKKSYGLYLRDGMCHLEPPTIVSLVGGVLKWGTVPNASGYVIKSKAGGGSWTEIARVPANIESSFYQSVAIEDVDPDAYYAVQAYAERNGKVEYSKYDTSFTLRNSTVGKDTNVLFFGDSLTFGSPYFGQQRGSFSYANRIRQLTGISLLNTAVSGATWHYDPKNQRVNIVNGVANMIALGETTDHAYASPQIGENTQTFEDFDVVVLAAGTNDYKDTAGTVLGSRETNWEKIKDKTTGITFTVNAGVEQAKTYTGMDYDYNIHTFNGSYNQIYKYIEEASLKRVLSGKPPIKVVSIGLFYSNRVGTSPKIADRNTTKNSLGYTMLKYQGEMKALNNTWAQSPVLDVYYYDSQATGIVSNKNCKYRSVDNLHYSRYTYGLYGDNMADFMLVSGVFNKLSPEGIEELKHSDAFKARLEKYTRSPAFMAGLSDELKAQIYELLGISEIEEPEGPEDPEEPGEDVKNPEWPEESEESGEEINEPYGPEESVETGEEPEEPLEEIKENLDPGNPEEIAEACGINHRLLFFMYSEAPSPMR